MIAILDIVRGGVNYLEDIGEISVNRLMKSGRWSQLGVSLWGLGSQKEAEIGLDSARRLRRMGVGKETLDDALV